jgi:hypothetical protein
VDGLKRALRRIVACLAASYYASACDAKRLAAFALHRVGSFWDFLKSSVGIRGNYSRPRKKIPFIARTGGRHSSTRTSVYHVTLASKFSALRS